MKKLIHLLLAVLFMLIVPSVGLADSNVYRLKDFQSGKYIYTNNKDEKDSLIRAGWKNEGVGWVAADSGKELVYRLYSPATGDRIYSRKEDEVNNLKNSGNWIVDYDGKPMFYSDGKRPVYRLYNDLLQSHVFTTDNNERLTLKERGWMVEGIAFYAKEKKKPLSSEFSGYEPGKKTIKNFLLAALIPVGTTNYVWGGGWSEVDSGSGDEAKSIGVSPQWKEFYDQQGPDYNYENTEYQVHNGLDCAGYVGWVVYNTLNTKDGGEGEVYFADEAAQKYSEKGYGLYIPYGQVRTFQPGDIISLNEEGHIYIVIGRCKDGSIVIAHSSPPGVMISGIRNADGRENQATLLADTYMKRYYPDYYKKYGNQLTRDNFYSAKCSKMIWKPTFIKDPEGIRNKDAESVLKNLFNEE